MPTYEYQCEECKHEWEDFLSMSATNPDCPKCQAKDKTKKLISLGSKGIVELEGQELVDKLKSDARKMKKEAAKDERVYANLLGEDRYQSLQTKMDQQKRERR
ncbi:MAG: FmdB family zinc ribbon protein [Nitrosotalea sp.]